MSKIDDMILEIDNIHLLQKRRTEIALAEIISKYDFIVGSLECKHKLIEILPNGANIIYMPYIENPMMVIVVKRFNIMDLLASEKRSD